jgi:ligand-binding sensor domain-containing protein/two-component sensor histidine kinase
MSYAGPFLAWWRRMAVLLLPMPLLLPLHAQQHAFAQYTTQDGLAQSQVRCMAQDSAGYLWFGTLGGASRFDGREFSNYALQEGLPDAQVNALLCAADGTIWLGAGGSLVEHRGRRMRNVPLPEYARGGRVLALAQGTDGALYIATDVAGVLVRRGNDIKALEGFPTDTARNARALLAAPDGRLFIGLRNGLLEWKEGKCTSIPVGGGSLYVNALARSPKGDLWVGTNGYGLYGLLADGRIVEYDEENGLLQNNVRSLVLDARGNVWAGTKFGLNIIDLSATTDLGRIRSFTVHQGLPNDNIWCGFQDLEGNLWFGTDGAGALRYTGDRFVTYTVKDGLCSDQVMDITPDAAGDLWLSTYGNGVCRMDGMAMVTTLDGLPNNTVWCGLLSRDGTLWFGTSDGICHLVNGQVVPLDSAASLSGSRVLALHEDPQGRLWCGTRDGLVMRAPSGTMQWYPSGPGGPGRSIRSIVPDKQGRLWLATDEGVQVFNGSSVTRYGTQEGSSDNTVFCLLFDGAGRLWAGTSNGLNCLVGERFRTIRLGQDFGSNYIDLLATGADGNVWVGTNNGLFRAPPDSLLSGRGKVEHYTMTDGLRSLECNLNAVHSDGQGRMLLGTAAGLLRYDPAREPKIARQRTPLVHLTGLRSFLQLTDWKGQCDSLSSVNGLPVGLQLIYRRNHVTFDYAAIDLADPDQVRYRYRLLGADMDWLPPTDARFASYSNLTQGDYTFEVIAAGRDGAWSLPQRFSFRILPPFWLRWWFFLACGSLAAGTTFGVMRYRGRQRQRREKTRQLMLRSRMLQLEQQALNANMNRHFIFNALNSIQYYINRQDRTAANRYLTSFAKLIRRNLDASQSDTTTLAEELERLELYLVLEHMRFKDKFRYHVEVEPGVDLRTIQIPAMMLQPYVENSIWHGILPTERPGVVSISVANGAAGRVVVLVADDGIGVDQSRSSKSASEGDHISRGIEITKGRADVLRRLDLSDIRITGPEQMHGPDGAVCGTRVTIDLPSKNGTGSWPPDLRNGHKPLIFGSS